MTIEKKLHFNTKDITGQKFGKLTVLAPTDKRVNRQIMWLCRCDCGKETLVSGNNLKSGQKSCGCLKNAVKDLSGKTFGRWLVLKRIGRGKHGAITWLCECACGTVQEVLGCSLRSGGSKSCGCLHKELLSGERSHFYRHGRTETPEYKKEIQEKSRARQYGQTTFGFDDTDVQKYMDDLGGCCLYCGGLYEETDHLIPLSRGGYHALTNLLPSCKSCNASKHDKYLGSEWWPKQWPSISTGRLSYDGGIAQETGEDLMMYQWEKELWFGRGKSCLVIIEFSTRRFSLGLGIERWSDWSGIMIYLGVFAIGIGLTAHDG